MGSARTDGENEQRKESNGDGLLAFWSELTEMSLSL